MAFNFGSAANSNSNTGSTTPAGGGLFGAAGGTGTTGDCLGIQTPTRIQVGAQRRRHHSVGSALGVLRQALLLQHNKRRCNRTPKTGGLFGATSSSTPAPTGGLFGASAPSTTSTAATAPKPLFGGFGAAATPSTTAPAASGTEAPKTGGLFGAAPAASATAPKPSATSATASKPLFGLGAAPATSTPSTTDASKPTGGLFGSAPATGASATSATPSLGLFGAKPAEPAKPGEATTTAPSTTSLFGPKPTAGAATTPAAPPPPTGGLFGLTPAPAAKDDAAKNDAPKTDAAAPAAPSLGGGLFGAKPAAATTPATATATANAPLTTPAGATAVPAIPPSALRGKSVEEIVNKWQEELETQTKVFKRTAQEIEVWDRALIENSVQISNLYSAVQAAEAAQQGIDGTLENIEEQQKSVAAALDGYEQEMKKIYGSDSLGVDVGPADGQREKKCLCHCRFARGSIRRPRSGLSTMIDSVNDLTSGPSAQTKDDPVAQISAILNAHLESLQWIDGAVRDAEDRVKEIEGTRTGTIDNAGSRSALGMSTIGASSFSASTATPRRGRYGL
ncbi:Nsp1-like C-terminal region [Rhizoctonia solani]|uniref:Nucleoporin NSP1 n=1 Tax=Rhizoctonia solani TaxID=456999 RepID=A0A8H7M4N9_9AGAM|nr:Nsp1-like C-terminal region [Rhizoctonia solani]